MILNHLASGWLIRRIVRDMNKYLAKIAYGTCLALSVAVTYWSFRLASNQAYAGDMPSFGWGVVGFLLAIGLVVAAIVIKQRYIKVD